MQVVHRCQHPAKKGRCIHYGLLFTVTTVSYHHPHTAPTSVFCSAVDISASPVDIAAAWPLVEIFSLSCVDNYDTIAVLGTMSRLGHYQIVDVHAISTSAFSSVAAATSSAAAPAGSPDSVCAAGSVSPSPSTRGVGASIVGVAGISGVAGRDSSCGSSCTSSCAFAAASTAIADAVADSRGSDTADVASRSAILTVLYRCESRNSSKAGWRYDMNSPLQKLSESRRTCQSPA
jgi:hypothetical protein